jgi:Protein of unknown function (DUF3307)
LPETLSVWWLVVLSLIFIIKHFVADFLLQTSWMALGKERAEHWILPLSAHAGIHAAATFLIVTALMPRLYWLAAVDFVIHFTIDRSKALISRAANTDPTKATFWWLLGFDQALHQFTDLAFVVVLAVALGA